MNKTKRRTIGDDPLDFVISHPKAASEPVLPISSHSPRIEKERLTVHLPLDLIERVRNVVFWTPGLTLAELAQMALAETVTRLEANRGEAYPPRTSQLKGGRPLK